MTKTEKCDDISIWRKRYTQKVFMGLYYICVEIGVIYECIDLNTDSWKTGKMMSKDAGNDK